MTYSEANVIVFVVLAFTIYFIPVSIAIMRDHHNTLGVFVVNLFLGWTFLGWVAALVWSFIKSEQIVVNNQSAHSVADEIQKLAKLKNDGLLTNDEFNKKKSEILNKE